MRHDRADMADGGGRRSKWWRALWAVAIVAAAVTVLVIRAGKSATSVGAGAAPRFVDETAAAGIDH